MKHTLISIFILLTLSFALGLGGCSSAKPRFIEEAQLKDIVTEAVITNALLEQPGHSKVDTLDPYTVILQRAGYTMEDMKYTISQMALRKSSPLENLFSQIYNEVSAAADQANYHYQQMQRYDSLVSSYVVDTIYRNDSLYKGLLSGGEISTTLSTAKVGKYTVRFNYQTHNSYTGALRQMQLKFIDSADSTSSRFTSWLHRSFKPREFEYVTEISDRNYDSLRFSIIEANTHPDRDTSWLGDIIITYMPSIEVARSRYLRDHTGLDLDSNYFQAYDFMQFQADSISGDSVALGPIFR